MRLSTAILLSRSRTPADRSRIRLTTVAVGLAGALLIGAFRIARLGPGDLSIAKYSNYLAEQGLRPGVAVAFVVLALLAAGLGGQALRIGVAARERRLSMLRLAGASPQHVRQLATIDAALAGLAGGLLAAPIYLAMSLALSAMPRMARLLPGVELWDLPVWLGVTLVTTAAGAAIGWLLAAERQPAESTPPFDFSVRPAVIAGSALAGIVVILSLRYFTYLGALIAVPIIFLPVASQTLARVGRRLTRSKDPATMLAGARLVADARSAGRTSALLAFCGLAIGVLANGTLNQLVAGSGISTPSDESFYLTGFSFGVFGLLLIAATAFTALLVGVSDQLVDQRRQLACLTALGVDARFLRRVIQRQLVLAASPALAIGLLVGSLVTTARIQAPGYGMSVGTHVLAAVALATAGAVLGLLGAVLAGFLLRNHLRDALDPENLRAA